MLHNIKSICLPRTSRVPVDFLCRIKFNTQDEGTIVKLFWRLYHLGWKRQRTINDKLYNISFFQ